MSDEEIVKIFTKGFGLCNILAIEFCLLHISDFYDFIDKKYKFDVEQIDEEVL